MNQTKLQPTHYEIFGYSYNPALKDSTDGYESLSADHVLHATNKKSCLGAVKIMLDHMDCEHIAIFRVDGSIGKKDAPSSAVRGEVA